MKAPIRLAITLLATVSLSLAKYKRTKFDDWCAKHFGNVHRPYALCGRNPLLDYWIMIPQDQCPPASEDSVWYPFCCSEHGYNYTQIDKQFMNYKQSNYEYCHRLK
ncbi:hypothetical protein PGT21_018716 [Puccinia graminis f. sp. tritici]|uniref:Secreted protein n=1 Tax=Puccinia graminis f. sp. tritici TaxID=56615 RepID=A0A5B0PEP5_PUCGR|nr:hypothetical protein PGTUg99_028850 [Puccinia graminis f. sp. tritici]KAA1099731.1 hypothetical protein PGT21_018716 [Puccinia graminis f. sp. tritici]